MRTGSKKLLHRLRRLITLDHGQDLIEYALVVALISCAATASMKVLASGIVNAYQTLSTTLRDNT
jgi:pilus assembly protein Flp/PilA